MGDDPSHVFTWRNGIFLEAVETLRKTLKIAIRSRMIDYKEEVGFVNCVHRRVRVLIG